MGNSSAQEPEQRLRDQRLVVIRASIPICGRRVPALKACWLAKMHYQQRLKISVHAMGYDFTMGRNETGPSPGM